MSKKNEATIHLTEIIHVSGYTTGGTVGAPDIIPSIPFTDWHEELWVINEAGGWELSGPLDGLFWSSVECDTPGGTVIISEPVVDIYFDVPQQYCSTITIRKDISVPGAYCDGYTFAIRQWPTIPEPGTMAMVAFGLLALRFRRK